MVDIAADMSLQVQGWINYYSKFGKTEFRKVMNYLNDKLVRWVTRKYKRFAKNKKYVKAQDWLSSVAQNNKYLFVHWAYGYVPYPRKCK